MSSKISVDNCVRDCRFPNARQLARDVVCVAVSLAFAASAPAALIPLSATYGVRYQGLQFSATGTGVIDTTGESVNWVVVTHPPISSPDPSSFAFALVHEVLGNGMRPRSPGDWNLWDFHHGSYHVIHASPWGAYSQVGLTEGVLVQHTDLQEPLSADPSFLWYRELLRIGAPEPRVPIVSDWYGVGLAGATMFESYGYYIGIPPHAFSGEMLIENFAVSRQLATEFRVEWQGWMVPEPGSCVLLLVGLAILANRRSSLCRCNCKQTHSSPVDS